jgi:hypothetical protein
MLSYFRDENLQSSSDTVLIRLRVSFKHFIFWQSTLGNKSLMLRYFSKLRLYIFFDDIRVIISVLGSRSEIVNDFKFWSLKIGNTQLIKSLSIYKTYIYLLTNYIFSKDKWEIGLFLRLSIVRFGSCNIDLEIYVIWLCYKLSILSYCN